MDTIYTVKINGLIKEKNKVELLILGNSHAGCGIDPHQFNSFAYNLAQVSQSVYFDKRITLQHIDQLKSLKYVIIGLDFHSLYFSSQGSRDVWSYYGTGVNYKNELPVYAKYSQLYGYGKLAVHLFARDLSKKYKVIKALDVESVDLKKPIVKGWCYYYTPNNTVLNEENYKDRSNYFNELVENSKEKNEIISDLEDFIIKLKNKGIVPIIVTTPCYEPYRKLLNQKLLKETELEIANLAKRFDIQNWNYFEYQMKNSDYLNCDHLNSDGASTFSKVLNSRILMSNIKQ